MNKNLLLSLFILLHAPVWSQQGALQGKIQDANNQPISYANIVLKGTSTGSASDAEGNFKLLALPVGEQVFAQIVEAEHVGEV